MEKTLILKVEYFLLYTNEAWIYIQSILIIAKQPVQLFFYFIDVLIELIWVNFTQLILVFKKTGVLFFFF